MPKNYSILIKNVLIGKNFQDVFIKENKIERIAKNLNLKAEEKIEGKKEKAVLAGLINCHSHSAMTLFRGYADDLSLKEWLEKKIWPLETKLTDQEVFWGTKLACLEMIKSGTTTFNEMYFYPEAQTEATKEMGLRATIGLVLLDFLPMGDREHVEKLTKQLTTRQLITIKLSIAPHSIYTVSKENLIWAKNFAKKNNLILHIHLSETEKEVKDCLKKYKLRPVEYLEKIGFLSEPRSRASSLRAGNCILAHSIWLTDKEIEILAKRKCSVVYNSCSNMKLGSGIFLYQKLKKARINICLGTDGPASNNNLDMFEEMKFASLLQKINKRNPEIAPAKEIFETATKNGAQALKTNTGEIRVGKLADLILVDLNQACLKPGFNLISDLVYSCNGSCVSDVICNGKILMRERKVEGEREIMKRATFLAKELIKK